MRYSQVCWIPHLFLIYSSSLVGIVYGFHVPTTKINSNYNKKVPIVVAGVVSERRRITAVQPLYFWGNKDKSNDDNDNDEASPSEATSNPKEEDDEEKSTKSSRGGLVGRLPFFANKDNEKDTTSSEEEEQQQVVAAASTTSTTTAASSPKRGPTAGARVKEKEEELDPVKKAQALRAQAERARLEAEKMDAELTLQKISRLEREMATAVGKDETDDVERLQREMDTLQAKIRGEKPPPPPPVVTTTPPTQKEKEEVEDVLETFKKKEEDQMKEIMEKIEVITPGSTITDTIVLPGDGGIQLPVLKKIDEEEFDSVKAQLEESPGFIKKLLAQMTEVDFDSADDVNVTEVTKRMIQLQNFDFSYSSKPKPSFTQSEIDAAIEDNILSTSNVQMDSLPDGVKGNATAEALLALEYNYYADSYDMSKMNDLLEGEDWLKEVIQAVNKSAVDSSIEVLYPKCTRKEGGAIPTMAQIQMLVADVLPKASFTVRGKPEEVAGGYIVRGTSKFETGDETIAAIDEQMEKSPMLKDKMTILYTSDFTLLAQEQEDFEAFGDFPDPADEPPILYIMGPDILPERKRIPLAVTTAFGIATSWYLSVYPFLLNPALLKRAEEQLELADASMAYDLSWLSELSFPLFVTFVGIQLAHEAGHKLVGAANGVKSTLPTFVPSLITGHTSSVTQFKELPKNSEAMFDFAIAGPLFGVLASIAALVVGSQLTLVSDPALLPSLPLDILRQSTLGGGIIDAILGNGALSVPPGAELTTAVQGMTVSLHPVAVAGYIGLIVNSLALLPIGTTDGGRIALSVFGRQAKPFIGNIFLITIFLVGFTGSDLFLFYFAFLSAFQTGNEIPARNEVDSISFPRVLLATGTTVLALLTLIPFQS